MFDLTPTGLKLVHVAPGINVERGILARLQFLPTVDDPGLTDARIPPGAKTDLWADLVHLDLPIRDPFDAAQEMFFLTFENMYIRSVADVALARRAVKKVFAPPPNKVDVIGNYDGCRIDDAVMTGWAGMVSGRETQYYRDRVALCGVCVHVADIRRNRPRASQTHL